MMAANPKTIFFLVRHGQSESNARDEVCGEMESPLTEEGERQIAQLAAGMRGLEFDVAYTSTLERAKRTCGAILQGRDIEPIALSSLREQDFGDWEGESYKTIIEDDPDAFASFKIDPVRARAPGGETLPEFVERVRGAFFDEMLAQHAGKRILVVSHGGTIRAALHLMLKIDFRQNFYLFDIQNAGLTIVKYGNGSGRLVGLNLIDPSHVRL